MKKKVMFLLYNMNIGGTEKALINMLDVMNPTEYEVDVFLLKKTGGFIEDIPDWVNLRIVSDYLNVEKWILDPPLKIVQSLVLDKKFFIALKLLIGHLLLKVTSDRTLYYHFVLEKMRNIKDSYDVAIAYAGPMDFITQYVIEKVNAKEKIQWIHFDVSKFHFNVEFAKRNYPKFDKVIVCAKESANSLIRVLPSVKDKVEVVPNFVSIKQCQKKAALFCPYTKEELNDKTIILTVGRLTQEKGQIIIPSVVKKLLEEGYDCFVWYIVGEGNQYELIKNEIDKYDLQNYIKMVGLQTNPYPFYANCDLYVQTSIHEGYCITIAEALVFNKYVISTDVAGAYDQITDDTKGVIVSRNGEQLLKAIRLRM